MQRLLIFSLQLSFYTFGSLAFLMCFRSILISNNDAVAFLISFIVSFIIAYFFKPLYLNTDFKKKSLLITVFYAWILFIFISSIPFFLLFNFYDIIKIIFISTSFFTTTGLSPNDIDVFRSNRSLVIWGSLVQLMGGFFSILTYILYFLILYNQQNKFIVFDKKLVIKFFVYFFLLFFLYLIILNATVHDLFISFMLSSAIISTGGVVGANGHLLDYYTSQDAFLYLYSGLILVTMFLLPLFLYFHNFKIFSNYYLKIIKRCFFLLVILILVFFFILHNNNLSMADNIFIFFSFLTTTGLLSNNSASFQEISSLFFIFLFLIFLGGIAGSSGGGLKIDRVSLIFLKIKDELIKLTLQHKIQGIEIVKKGSNQKELNSLYSIIALGLFSIIIAILLLTFTGNNIFESFVFSIASLTNTGDGFLIINGTSLKKTSGIYLILNFLMICGRFEIIGYLLIFKKLSQKT